MSRIDAWRTIQRRAAGLGLRVIIGRHIFRAVGIGCAIPRLVLLDDDPIRAWHRLYEEDRIDGLANFGHKGSACRLNIAPRGRKVIQAQPAPEPYRNCGHPASKSALPVRFPARR